MKNQIISLVIAFSSLTSFADTWKIDTQTEWTENLSKKDGLKISEGLVSPSEKSAVLSSIIKRFDKKRSAQSIEFAQSTAWKNWETKKITPANLADAPIALSLGPNNYWLFGRYSNKKKNAKSFVAKPAKLDGFDIPLVTSPYPNQFNAPGGLKKSVGGYHAWQSRDLVNWVHHGPVSDKEARWMTSAEFVDGKAYFYYDFPNDQDPHLILDDDITDGIPGKKMGMVFKDPSHGSDSTIIRAIDGKFHVIAEDWSPINASTHAWDSPLATRGVSPDGISPFKVAPTPPVDNRTKPTGKIGTYKHPHWVKEDPKNYKTSVAEYEIHEPEQEAYGDWAAIAIGGQYYMFADYDPVGGHMGVCWFTSSDISKPFTWCGSMGKGHPDPDIMFAEGRFHLVTQFGDYVSPGPWIETVEARVGVDTDNDGKIDNWTDWQEVKENYDYTPGFAKQVAKAPAKLDLSKLPAGFGFQFEIKITDSTDNESIPELDKVSLNFLE